MNSESSLKTDSLPPWMEDLRTLQHPVPYEFTKYLQSHKRQHSYLFESRLDMVRALEELNPLPGSYYDGLIKIYKELIESFHAKYPQFFEIRFLLLEFFKGDTSKVSEWLRVKNPLLGNISPDRMMKLGRSDKLLEFIKNAIDDNKID